MVKNSFSTFRRVVVVLDTTVAGRLAMEGAVKLAAGQRLELLGLFIEDIDLLRSAALPFTREVGITSATLRPIDAAMIEQRLGYQAKESRRLLEETAAHWAVPWSFRISRGRLEQELFSSTQPADLLVLKRMLAAGPAVNRLERVLGHMASTADRAVMFFPEQALAADRPILALYEAGTEAAHRCLLTAAAMARATHQSLVILVEDGDAAEAEQAARERVRQHGVEVRVRRLYADNVPALVNAIRQERGQAVIITRASRFMQHGMGRHLLKLIEVPVIVQT